uniref:Uncharacterized protein n=1 Tax=Magallana gigas TaxID=29159 RepID=A0A8W8M7K8_MAGGI
MKICKKPTKKDNRFDVIIWLSCRLLLSLQDGILVQRLVRLLQQLFPLSGHVHCAMLHCGQKRRRHGGQHADDMPRLLALCPSWHLSGRQST